MKYLRHQKRLALVLAVSCGLASTAEAGICTIWGRAINNNTGDGIAKMSVKIEVSAFTSSASTFSDGFFVLDALPGQGYELSFLHPNYETKRVVLNTNCLDNSFVSMPDVRFRPRFEFSVSSYSPTAITFDSGKAKTQALILTGKNLHTVSPETQGCINAKMMDQPMSGNRLVLSITYNGNLGCTGSASVSLAQLLPGGVVIQRQKLPLPIGIRGPGERDRFYRLEGQVQEVSINPALVTRGADVRRTWSVDSRSAEKLTLSRKDESAEVIDLQGQGLDQVAFMQVVGDRRVVAEVAASIVAQSPKRLLIVVAATRNAVLDNNYQLYFVTDEGQYDAGVTISVTE